MLLNSNTSWAPTSHPRNLVFFCFYGSSDNLDLHSFPTRRSSDLRRVRAPGLALACLAGCGYWLMHASIDWFWEFPDRKSTRLNSSHEWNSYAVFCLKKKNPSMRRL